MKDAVIVIDTQERVYFQDDNGRSEIPNVLSVEQNFEEGIVMLRIEGIKVHTHETECIAEPRDNVHGGGKLTDG